MVFTWKLKNEKKTEPDPVLVDELMYSRRELESAYSIFDFVTDPDLIDSSIYRLNAAQLRYKFLLNQIKKPEDYAKNPLEASGS